MKQRYLLPLLLLTPCLAHADPLNNGALGGLVYVYLVLLGLAALALLLLVVAFLRPWSKWLQIVQGALLLVFLWGDLTIGFLSDLLGSGGSLALSGLLALGMLLNGLTQARQAQQPRAVLCWTGIAVIGSTALLAMLLQQLVFGHPLPLELATALLGTPVGLGTGLVAAFGGWLLVLVLLRRRAVPAALLWSEWWPAPTVGAAISVGYFCLNLLKGKSSKYSIVLDWAEQPFNMLLVGTVCWLAGIAALRLLAPPTPLSVEEEPLPS